MCGANSGLRLRDQVRLRLGGRSRTARRNFVRRTFGLRSLPVLHRPAVASANLETGVVVIVVRAWRAQVVSRRVVVIRIRIVRRIVGGVVTVIRVVGIRRPRVIPERIVPPRIPAEPPAAPIRPSEPEAPTTAPTPTTSPTPTAAPTIASPTIAAPSIATPTKARRSAGASTDETGRDSCRSTA
jgi:hypothetical protein